MSQILTVKNTIKRNIRYSGLYIMLLVLVNLFLAYKVIKVKYFSYYPDYTFNRKSLFEKLNVNIDSSSIVFIGNSLTQQYELAEFFKNVNIKNRGINGDNSSGILSRLRDIIKFHPKKIFIENGVNDLKEGVGEARLLDNFIQIFNMIKQESATSKLYVQSILPVYQKGAALGISVLNNDKIRIVNRELEAYCKTHNITFINLHEHFELNSEMDPKYCIADGLHISADGYVLWTKLLKQYVSE